MSSFILLFLSRISSTDYLAQSLALPGWSCRFWSFIAMPMFPEIFNLPWKNAWKERKILWNAIQHTLPNAPLQIVIYGFLWMSSLGIPAVLAHTSHAATNALSDCKTVNWGSCIFIMFVIPERRNLLVSWIITAMDLYLEQAEHPMFWRWLFIADKLIISTANNKATVTVGVITDFLAQILFSLNWLCSWSIQFYIFRLWSRHAENLDFFLQTL